jgi:hypothetical protein
MERKKSRKEHSHVLKEALKSVVKSDNYAIFNGERQDGKRVSVNMQSKLEKYPRVFAPVLDKMNKVAIMINKSLGSSLTAKDPVLIYSESGCVRQQAHCDYGPMERSQSIVPVSVLISTDDETYLGVWPGSINRYGDRRPRGHTMRKYERLQLGW